MKFALLVVVALLVWLPLLRPAGAQAQTPGINPDLPTLFIIGDSTVRNGTPGQKGWGDPIAEMFDRTRINVVNRARGGRSSRTFQTEGLWDAVLADAKPGDFVMIQFGHNDGGPLDDAERARGSIRGTGDETKEIYNPIQKRQEVVHTYGWYMRKYITDARDKGMTPIVLSLVPRCPRPGATVEPATQPSGYALWAREVAEAEGAAFIDLNDRIMRKYVGMTPEEIKAAYFCEADYTHTNAAGAKLNAETVVEGLRALEGCALVNYLKE